MPASRTELSPPGGNLRNLPPEPADRLTNALSRFLQIDALAGFVLLAAAVAAVLLSNSPWAASFLSFWELPVGLRVGPTEWSRSIRHWINDGCMTLFFFAVALELKRELVLGELRNPRMAALSLAAALGGILAPASLYLTVLAGQPGATAWGTVMATDTAFVIGCLAVLGNRVPLSLRLFLLSLAIFDDIAAVLVIALAYGESLNWSAIVLTACGFLGVAALARVGVRSIAVYFATGIVIWFIFDQSGVHATVAGVVLGLMTPTDRWVSGDRLFAILSSVQQPSAGEPLPEGDSDRADLQRARTATREALSPVERLEPALHPWVAFGVMPLFALANAGVSLSSFQFQPALAGAVFLGLVVGKPLGIFAFSLLAVRLRLAERPDGLTWPLLAAGGLLTGIGFTMALFIAELAYPPALLNSAKIGILAASVLAGAAGLLVLFWLTSSPAPHGSHTKPRSGYSDPPQ